MVRRHLTIPHRIACVTNHPEGIDDSIEIISPPGDFEDVRIGTWGEHLPQCHRRLAMFRPDAADIFGERFVCMDLDCVVGGSLDPLFDISDDFAMYNGTSASRPYNGSMMMMRAGARPQVYTEFTPERAEYAGRRFIGSDQAWISHCLGKGERVWGVPEGVYSWSQMSRSVDAAPRLVFFPGDVKPWHLVLRSGWVGRHYRGEEGGRCLVLGVGPSVWDDAGAVDHYDAVIALPEAAMRWPGPIREVVEDDRAAERAARMHGFSEIVWCGKEAD